MTFMTFKGEYFMFYKVKSNFKVIILVVSLSYSHVGFSMNDSQNEANHINSEHKISKGMVFPGTSMPEIDWWKALWPDPKEVILSLDIQPNMISIDLCCGYGYFTPYLAQSSLRTYGVEIDSDLIENACRKCESQNIKNCFLIQGDAMNVDTLIPEKADFILLANTFHGVPDKEAFAKSMFAALKPKGKLAIINWHQKQQEETKLFGIPTGPSSEMRMSPSDVEDIMHPLGFFLQKTIDFPPYHYGVLFIKG